MAEHRLQLDVVTPDQSKLSTKCDFVVVRSTAGEMGFLPDHAPLVAALVPQVMRYTADDEEKKLFISGGFVEVNDNIISVMAPAAELASDIDFERAEAARNRALERLKHKENIDTARAFAALSRANARLSMRNYVASSKE